MAEHRGKTQVFFRLPSFVSILQQFSLQSGPFECASLLCLGKSYRAGYVSVGDAPWIPLEGFHNGRLLGGCQFKGSSNRLVVKFADDKIIRILVCHVQ